MTREPFSDWRAWPPDVQQVERAQAGDERVLTAVLTAAMPKLVAFYRGLGLALVDAEDVASEAAIAIVRNLPRLRDPARFEPWFWRIARSKLNDHLRKKQRLPKHRERDANYQTPEELTLLGEEYGNVQEVFLTLSRRDRELLWMRDVIGLPYGDIAGRIPLAEGALRIAVMRARKRFEEGLGRLDGE
jgi:RNA polymerase sigma-70 factor (ECF subfamily)